MLPFSVDSMILEMRHNMNKISADIIKYKSKFCNEFEKELSLEVGEYSHSIFDYLFNLFYFKKAFGDIELRKLIEEFKDMNFLDIYNTSEYIKLKYNHFIVAYKKHFLDYFGFKNDDPLYIQRKMDANKHEILDKLLRYN